MTLNPITALSDLLGKLVIEHGSAIITEKNLAFLRDQLAVTEKEITKLTNRLEKFESKYQTLKTQFQNLKNENKELKKKIETYEKPTHDDLLDKVKVKILQCLATLPPEDGFPLETIMSVCKLSEHIATYHLQELEDESMIECGGGIDGILCWFLDHDGRGYLIKHKLIS